MNKKGFERRIPSAGPSITEKEVKMIAHAAKHGWYERRNEGLDAFIKKYAALTDRKYVLPTSLCTAALHLALKVLAIGPGDEVIIAETSWIAPAAAIVYIGAIPIFADIDIDTWGLSPASLEKKITKRTKAVIVVDTYGSMPRMREILSIAKKHKLRVIEDSAEALGSYYRGKPAGSFGDISVMSFNATKLATAGQGGVFATNDKRLFEAAKRLTRHGMLPYTPNSTFWSDHIGYNYEWTNMQAAFALAQLERLPELLRFKQRAFSWYEKHLKDIPGVVLNPELPNTKSNRWLAVAIFDRRYRIKKEKLVKIFQERGIDLRPFFYPLSMMPPFQKYVRGKRVKDENLVAYDISVRGICLPSSYRLTESDVRIVCDMLRKELTRYD